MGYLGQDTPKLGFGLMRLPKDEEGVIDVPQVADMVDAFLDSGCTYFDTARAYAGSEAAIRKALVERHPRDSYTLATKNAAWSGATSGEEAKAYFETSLEQSGAGYFDYYLLHNLGGTRTDYFDRWGMWDWVRNLKEQGKVRHWGFSFHDNAETLEALLNEHPDAEFVQLQINYADWDDGSVQSRKIHEVARAHGKPIVIMEPVKGGTLANPPGPVREILLKSMPDREPVEWALRFAMNVEGLICALSGMSSIAQMEDNLAILKRLSPLTEAELATFDEAREALSRLIAVPCTACHYCMDDCPVSMPISPIMESLNRNALYGIAKGRNHYNFGTRDGVRASDCIKCGQCEAACPQHIEIIRHLEEAASIFE